ncbi:MAG: carboxypeptidase regulatory-like domain-containing protein [Janthinobacterium lividum]
MVSASAVACLALGLATAPAQEAAGRLTGTVADASGAVIPNGTVTVTNADTKQETAHLQTDQSGHFAALQLPPGRYTLNVRAEGFRTFTLANILLNISQTTDIPVSLQPGDTSSTVEVQANEQVALESGTSTLSTVFNPTQVRDLPLPNRDITQLIALTPGVVIGGNATNLNNAQISINGSRTLNTEILVDGTSVINGATGNLIRLPSLDDLDEFRIITSTAPAEYGRTSGAVITFATRYGTSAYHGGVYELFRNNVLDANSYFNKLNGTARQVDNYNQFGVDLGGPLFIPHFYPQKKTFFYLNYDQTIQRQPGTATATVASAAFRAGNFSSSPVVVKDPLTGKQISCNGVANVICANRIDPAAAAILALEPLPNTVGTFDATNNRYTNNYYTQQSLASTQPRYSGRIDQTFTEKTRAFASATRQINPSRQLLLFNDILNPTYQNDDDQGWEAALGFTHEFSPSLVMALGFGTVRDNSTRIPTSVGTNPTQTVKVGTASAPYTPQFTVTGFTTVGTANGSYSKTINNGFNYFGSVTKVLGVHTFKTGASFRKDQLNIFNPGVQPAGTYAFSGEITSLNSTTGVATNALADFLLGAVKTSSYGLPQPADGRRNYNIGVYLQDDYKVNSKLLVNAGVRYEYESPMTIADNRYSRVDPATGILLVANQNASNTLNLTTPKLDFSPRVGLIFTPNQKTVFRAAFGTYYGLIFSDLGGQVGYPGFEVTQNFTNQGTGVAQPFTLSQGQPLIAVQNLNDPTSVVAKGTVANPYTPGSASFGKISPLSQTQQWNAGIQQEMYRGIILQVDYVASHGVHLPLYLPNNLVDPNQATQVAFTNTTTATQLARPFHTLGAFSSFYNVGSSSYNSLQLSGRKNLSRGLTVSGSYTWSHAIDDGSGIYNYSQPNGLNAGQYPSDPTFRHLRDRSNSSFDVRHNFQENATYTTKGPWYLRNFLISETTLVRTGLPQTITQTNEFPGVISQRPNGSSTGLKIAQYKNGSGIQYYMPASSSAFPLTPSGPIFVGTGTARKQVVATSLGTLGRYSIYGPGLINVNASVGRTFSIFESVKFQLRIDAFNVMNHTNFNAPGSALTVTTPGNVATFASSSSFGLITGSAPGRFMQAVTRITF